MKDLQYIGIKESLFSVSFSIQLGVATNPNDKALIHNFWIVALGHFNQTVINEINKRMHGKLVHIDQPEDLVDAYANFAEILT